MDYCVLRNWMFRDRYHIYASGSGWGVFPKKGSGWVLF
jgi:hypothetical protein